ncbi:TetR/AcrR family transcriptional regulator [Glycomyces sp. NPDC047010]|uniref:TetR/AcrR family transcriptional regulator n=1 Tax=Glycomyces sp. NPDC047010 TaxID=3155023 RepID=UPI0033D08D10
MTGNRPGRPARLSRERIVAAALDGGLAELTMRELAARLDVSHAALYRWVRDRDALMDLVSAAIVERIVPATEPTAATWREWLAALAWAMHDEFLAVPGFASHVARPHRHDPASFGLLRDRARAAFTAAGCSPAMAEQSWRIFGLGVVQWLGGAEAGLDLGPETSRFDLYLDVLLRGLPAREPAEHPRTQ